MTADPCESIWAKSLAPDGLPLVRHLLDVAAVSASILETLPRSVADSFAESFSLPREDATRWLTYLVGAHDIGKVSPGFQAKWAPGRERLSGCGFSFPSGAPDRHDAASASILRRDLAARGVARRDAAELADAVAAHHGALIPNAEWARAGRGVPKEWEREQERSLAVLAEVIGIADVPRLVGDPAVRSRLLLWIAGLCSTSDWLGSSTRYFDNERERAGFGEWYTSALRIARRAIVESGIGANGRAAPCSPEAALRHVLPAGATPRPLQSACSNVLASAPTEPFLLVIEAPMGEGKTEAALMVDAVQRGAGRSRGLFVGMPTQATSNAILDRVGRYLASVCDDAVELQLAHGAAGLDSTRLRLSGIGFGDDDAAISVSAWLAGRKRVMLAPNAVGTIDQALIAVLNARHHFVRLFGLADRVVVIDEVHAYDAYTGTLIARLVEWLLGLRCVVVVMSATLPASVTRALLRVAGSGSEPVPDYPRLSLASPSVARSVAFDAARSERILIERLPHEVEAVVRSALESAARGACVLVIVNKVARAQRLFRRLARDHHDVLLFHSRFPMEERLATEAEVLRRFGPSGQGRAGGILVATQVAEQSLDVDFDVLITDLAPVDLLLQRCGRVHRHTNPRPAGHECPVVRVAGLPEAVELPVPELTSWVYEALPVLRTVLWLAGRQALDLPGHIDESVQWVYGEAQAGPLDTGFAQALEVAAAEFDAERTRQAQLGSMASIASPGAWASTARAALLDDDAADSSARFGTRLGEESVSCIPVHLRAGEWMTGPDGQAWSQDVAVPRSCAKALGQRYLRSSRRDLVAALRGVERPLGWDSQPELRAHHPLPLDADGRALLEGVAATLDGRLGLIFGSLDEGVSP